MEIRDLDSKVAMNELVRNGFRHVGDYGIILNTSAVNTDFFKLGQPYRALDGRIIVVQHGTMDVEIDLVRYVLHEGDIAVVLPEALMLIESASSDCAVSAVVFRQMPQVKGSAESFVVSGDSVAFARANQYLTMIFDQFDRNPVFTDIIVHFYDALILDMFSLRQEEQLSHGGEFMHRFLQLLTKEGRTKHPIGFYADRLCVSPNYMSALVKRESGLTVLQWIDRALVREAKVLLHHTQMPVAEVAEKLGLATPSFFIRFFRQQTGQTPLQYRKQG
ncbi:MAG: AraC family transcriptional regulator [Bacteroidales bacterium]|nr:AraC family transcriptional regulator [Bacteroidales bacterium]